MCLNGGTFNTSTGMCDCPTGFTGSNCSGKISCSAALSQLCKLRLILFYSYVFMANILPCSFKTMTIFVHPHTLSNFCVSYISHRAAHSHTHLYDSQQCTDGHPTSIHCRECKTNHEYYYCKLNGSLTLVYFCGKNPKLNVYTFFLVAI